MILGATITGSLTLNGVNLASITGSEASINALNSFTASAATTGSNVFKSNQTVTGSVDITGSLTVVGPITGTVTTASYVLNAVSASYALNATTSSYALNATSASQANNANTATSASYALNATTSSFALNAITSSFALVATSASYALASTSASFALTTTSASYALAATSASYALVSTSASYAANSDLLDGRDSLTFANTGSNAFVGTQNINGAVAITGSLTTTGAITAQTLNVQQVTSSIVYSSGSNVFGNSVSNTQSMTGSVGISGSLAVVGAGTITGALTLNSTITNGTYTYTLPSATGTLALTSALSSYLPLSAGSSYPLTGDLYIRKSDGFQNIIIQPTTTTAAAGTRFLNTGNDMYMFIDNSGGDYGPTGANGASFAYNANIRVVGNRALQIATNDTVRMTISNGGNVGIGTTSPNITAYAGTVLTVGAGSSGETAIEVYGGKTGADGIAGDLAFLNSYATGADKRIALIRASRSGDNNSGSLTMYSRNAGTLTAALTIASTGAATFSGNLGVGTNKTSGVLNAAFEVYNNATGAASSTKTRISGGSNGANGGTMDNEYAWNDYGNVDQFNLVARIRGVATSNSGSDVSGKLEFYTKATGGTYLTSPVLALTIASTGQITQSTTISDWSYVMSNSNATSPNGIIIQYTAANKNNTSNPFLYCVDNSGATLRMEIRSNGGIANYSANDVNLSDERVKKDIEPLESYWDKFKAIEIVKFKYKDQTHDDFNIGVIAQQVEAVAPEFVDVDGWDNKPKLDEEGNEIINDEEPLKSIYTADLYHATIKVLQECMSKIESQQAQITELNAKITELENK